MKSPDLNGKAMQRSITDDLDLLLDALPPRILKPLRAQEGMDELLEVILDFGRVPEARFLDREVVLSDEETTEEDLAYVTDRIGVFGQDNRAGIERTLHRISAIRNREGTIIGLTCRVGRAVHGTIKIIEDLVRSERSILLMGRPGVGKTTMLREVARVLADDFHKRVIVVDTSNEIAGDGDIPHAGIGKARRMQVATPGLQHEVMIEAVENHMPQAIIIDEIGREIETLAARTIAERGVQLVATAHGNTLENLILNPTLADLIGGIQAVTLGDDEARRRGTQKTILERKAPPTFDSVVEIQSWDRVAVHKDVAKTVDAMLRRRTAAPDLRSIDSGGQMTITEAPEVVVPARSVTGSEDEAPQEPASKVRVLPFGVNRGRTEQVIKTANYPVELVNEVKRADAVVTTKAYYRNRPQVIRDAEGAAVPVYVLRKNTAAQIEQSLVTIIQGNSPQRSVQSALQEAETAAGKVRAGDEESVDLTPQTSYIRRLQHQVAERNRLTSRSSGREPFRRVKLFRT
jgi:stage III sporulation protein SpoIIIAA